LESTVSAAEALRSKPESSGFGIRIQWIRFWIQWIRFWIQWIRDWKPVDSSFEMNASGVDPLDFKPESVDSDPESTGFGLRNERFWSGSTGFGFRIGGYQLGIQWVRLSE
jgi:hypothetical protein